MGDEEKVKGKNEGNPGREEEGDRGQDTEVTRQGDVTTRGDLRMGICTIAHSLINMRQTRINSGRQR